MNQPEEWIVVGLLRASFGLSVTALLVTLLIKGLRLHAPRAEQWAWSLVLMQGVLLVPLAISVPAHWLEQPVTSQPTGVTEPVPIQEESKPGVSHSNPNRNRTASAPVSTTDPSATTEQPTPGTNIAIVRAPRPSAPFPWFTIAYTVWMVGMVLLLALGWFRYRTFIRRLSANSPTCEEWETEWRELLRQQGITASIPLVITQEVGPALCRLPAGYRLVIPHLLWKRIALAERLAIMRHELAHYQRGDIWTSLLARSVALIHWFNPLAWWAVARFEAQSEFSCDRAAAGDDPASFAAALVHLVSAHPSRLVAAQSARTGSLVERVKRLLSNGTRSPLWKGVLLVAVAVLCLTLTSVRLKSMTLSGDTDSAEQKVEEIQPTEPTQTAKVLLQLGTNDLRTRDFITDIAFSPDGKQIAAAPANGETPRVWLFDVATGREVKRIIPPEKPAGSIRCLSFSPDQTKLLWGERGGFVALWDLNNDRLLFREKLHRRGVNDVLFSTQGELFASAGEEGVVHLRNVADPAQELERFATGQQDPKKELGGDSIVGNSGVSSLAFTTDDRRLITGFVKTNEILVWEIEDGKLLLRINQVHGGGSSSRSLGSNLSCLTLTPDGRRIMSSGNRTVPLSETQLEYGSSRVRMSEIRFWDIETGERTQDLHGPTNYGSGYAALARDGKRVAVGDYSLLRILDAESGKVEQSISLPGSWGNRPEFSPDGRLVAMPIVNTIGLFDVKTGRRLHHDESTPVYGLQSAAWSPDGNRIVTGHWDGGVRIWDVRTGRLIWHKVLAPIISLTGWNANPYFVTFSADGRRVIAAGRRDDPVEYRNGIVAIYRATDGRLLREVHEKEIRAAALSPDGEVLVVATSNGSADDTKLHGIAVGTGQKLYVTPPEEARGGLWQLKAMQFPPGTNLLQVALGNGEVIRFDALTGKEQHRLVADWRTEEQLNAGRPRRPDLWEAAFTPDGRTLVSSAAEYVYVWNVDAGKLRLKIRHPHDHGCYVSISPDGKMFATSDLQYAGDYGQDTIRLYNLETGEAVMKAEPDDNRARVLIFSPDGTKLFSGYYRGSAEIWDVRR